MNLAPEQVPVDLSASGSTKPKQTAPAKLTLNIS